MSYLVLARKYRPQTFEEVVRQSHVTRTLMNAISSGRVAHAMLFSGPRGTGKTTVARILAKAMNCKEGPTPRPCGTCRSCEEIRKGATVDVFEIDGASNNGVDHIRDLRDNVKYMPVHSRSKIYIIDEVHMLSTAAFNALLKTLEEPPAHVLFFFATTEPNKIPITILSRCQRHDLRRVDMASLADHLRRIADQEGIDIDAESLGLIARKAGGSVRDSLSLLDQVIICAEGPATPEAVSDILGLTDRRLLYDIAACLPRRDVRGVLERIDAAYEHGRALKDLYGEILDHFRNLYVAKTVENPEKLIDLPAHETALIRQQAEAFSTPYLAQILDMLFKEEAAVRYAMQPRLAVEMAFVRLLQIEPVLPIDMLIRKLDSLKRRMDAAEEDAAGDAAPEKGEGGRSDAREIREDPPPFRQPPAPPTESAAVAEPDAVAPPAAEPVGGVEENWEKFVQTVCGCMPSAGAVLSRCGLLKVEDDALTLEVSGPAFNMKQIEKHKAALKKECAAFFRKPMDIRLQKSENDDSNRRTEQEDRAALEQQAMNHPLVSAAVEIFDGSVVEVKIL